MDSLAPPSSLGRHRASSTNVRPPLTLSSLGRRRSNSELPPPPHTPVGTPAMQKEVARLDITGSAPSHKLLARATFVELYSRVMDLLHVSQKDSPYSSAPSSPRLSRSSISTEDTLLPIVSPTVATFGEAYSSEKAPTRTASWWQGTPSVHAPMFFVIAAFPLSTALLLFCMSTLPITTAWPRNLTDLAQLGRELHGYSVSGAGPMAHVIGVLSIIVAWNHAWSIPGSVLWNVLAGALFSPLFATILLTVLTAAGSVFASLLAAPLAPYVVKLFPKALDLTRNAIEGASKDTKKPKSSPWIRLSILRLVGIVPWSGINIACGVCGVPILDCVLGSFIGCMPWTAVTCQIGDILQTVASTPSPTPQSVQSLLTSPDIMLKLVFLTFLSLAPILGRNHLQALLSHSSASSPADGETSEVVGDERTGRWAWVKDWRERIRVPSRSRARESSQAQLEVLIREKNASLPL